MNFAFKQAGLIEVDDKGKIRRWDAYYYGAGGFVLLKNPNDAALRDCVGTLLRKIAAEPANGIQTVWNQQELGQMGAEPRATFGIDMKDGWFDVSLSPRADTALTVRTPMHSIQ